MKKNIIAIISISLIILITTFTLDNLLNLGLLKTSVLESDGKNDKKQVSTLGITANPVQIIDGAIVGTFRYSADPGQIIKTNIDLYNLNTDLDLVADVYAVGTDPDRANLTDLDRSNPGEDAKWFTIEKMIPMKKGETKRIPVVVNVPKLARPGDHILQIMVETVFPKKTETGKQEQRGGGVIEIKTRTAINFFLKVSGSTFSKLTIGEMTISKESPYVFSIVAKNDGNMIARPRVSFEVKTKYGQDSGNNVPMAKDFVIQPGGKTTMESVWDFRKIGIYNIRAKITFDDKKEIREGELIIYPTAQEIIITIVVIFIFVLIIFYLIRRRRNMSQYPQAQYPQQPNYENQPPRQ